MVSRPKLLSTLGESSALLAGCSVLSSEPPGVAIQKREFLNRLSERRTVEYRIDRDGQ
ncbi:MULTISPECIES: hypothetical protein [unclassified Halorhabdus]|uniref:hypothetical protein n=1 Tax=unclassified Halorhabdus TaxID=2621901 RepID=UPI0012B33A06|nr:MULTISPECIES: hypothetical protein [unclassified Halorhabdus]